MDGDLSRATILRARNRRESARCHQCQSCGVTRQGGIFNVRLGLAFSTKGAFDCKSAPFTATPGKYLEFIQNSSRLSDWNSQNKTLAAELHRRDPEKFTDSNHKPEIALALGPFEAFCGFKPLEDVAKLLELEPLKRFKAVVKKIKFDDQSLKGVVRAMLEASDDVVAETGASLQRLPKESFGKDTHIPEMLPRLWKQYDKTV